MHAQYKKHNQPQKGMKLNNRSNHHNQPQPTVGLAQYGRVAMALCGTDGGEQLLRQRELQKKTRERQVTLWINGGTRRSRGGVAGGEHQRRPPGAAAREVGWRKMQEARE